MTIRRFLIDWVLPKILHKFLLGVYAGWHGYYNSFESARSKAGSYSDSEVFIGVLNKTLSTIKEGDVLERDGAIINERVFQVHVLVGLILSLSWKQKGLKVLDFGGGLGSLYRELKNYLPFSNWVVVEQPGLVSLATGNIDSGNLQFRTSLSGAYKLHDKYELAILSSVLQYLENPYEDLNQILSKKPRVVVVDRTLFSKDNKSYVSVQRVPKSIYGFPTSYPCWILNKEELLGVFNKQGYVLVGEFRSSIDETNRWNEEFLGFVFKYEN